MDMDAASPESCLAVGLMSGTSLDGVDACVVEITEPTEPGNPPKLRMVGFFTRPYPEGLRGDLTALCVSGTVTELCRYNALLGRVFADAAQEVVSGCGLSMDQISVIGSHGQTVHHLPSPTLLHGYTISSTLQIGDSSIIANHCRVTTVGDFRGADMAVGGQGAPLVPYLDEIILRSRLEETGRVGLLLNIGGISNISALTTHRGNDERDVTLLGFDCGPGNVLIDTLMKKWFDCDFDRDGEMALTGKTSIELLDYLMKDEFIFRQPPKSTGREYYGEAYLDSPLTKMDKLHIARKDVIATLSEFTAAVVWKNYQLFIEPHFQRGAAGYDLYVSGGGAKNAAIMRALERRFEGFKVSTTKEIGIDPDAKEALCFALLGYQTWRGRPTNVPSECDWGEGTSHSG
ncbi:anhydro-N-acetylmuramic acid kinase-like isoform X2 [Halichondria panicea]|uniref:anhydro-N-acetylmuramic acid kinase-like isoform X2 n=1 Tax=Halichondria panicea TaxID=6063 RepID=UPI00312B7C75